jgi:hypothetical protein
MIQGRTSRQRAGRPVISFRVSAALHQEAENFRRTHGLTWEALLQQAISGGIQPDVKKAYRQGHDDGFREARRQFGLSAICGRCGELTRVYANQFQWPINSRTGLRNLFHIFCPKCQELPNAKGSGAVRPEQSIVGSSLKLPCVRLAPFSGFPDEFFPVIHP